MAVAVAEAVACHCNGLLQRVRHRWQRLSQPIARGRHGSGFTPQQRVGVSP